MPDPVLVVAVSLLEGPDLVSAKKQTGLPTIQTSGGELDRDTVMNGLVGGVGTVSIQQMV